MSVELVNGHVVIPNLPDGSVEFVRRWQADVADGVTGRELRAAVRSVPRVSIGYTVAPAAVADAQMLDDRIRAALKSGKACVPYFGRGGQLTADADADTVTIADSFAWQAGDYLFLGNEDGFDAIAVTAAVLAAGVWTLTLDDAVTRTHPAGTLGWPLLFGLLTVGNLQAVTPRLTPVALKLTETTSARAAQLGAVLPSVGAGIGHMAVAEDFEIA